MSTPPTILRAGSAPLLDSTRNLDTPASTGRVDTSSAAFSDLTTPSPIGPTPALRSPSPARNPLSPSHFAQESGDCRGDIIDFSLFQRRSPSLTHDSRAHDVRSTSPFAISLSPPRAEGESELRTMTSSWNVSARPIRLRNRLKLDQTSTAIPSVLIFTPADLKYLERVQQASMQFNLSPELLRRTSRVASSALLSAPQNQSRQDTDLSIASLRRSSSTFDIAFQRMGIKNPTSAQNSPEKSLNSSVLLSQPSPLLASFAAAGRSPISPEQLGLCQRAVDSIARCCLWPQPDEDK